MTRKTLLIILLTVIINAAWAVVPDSPINAGLKIGYVSNKITTDLNDERIDTYMLGAFARINIWRLYIQPEWYYSTKQGASKDTSVFEKAGDFDFSSSSVPILIGYKLIDEESLKIRINVGSVFTFVSEKDIKKQVQEKIINNFNENYSSVQFGAGVDFLKFGLDISVQKGGKMADIPSMDFKDNVFMVTLSYSLL